LAPLQMQMTLMAPLRRLVIFLGLLASSCQRSTYPCPDIQGGTEVVKAGSTEGLKKTDVDMDSNGRLTKKPYGHAGMKKKKN
jgi:hypothetical protein